MFSRKILTIYERVVNSTDSKTESRNISVAFVASKNNNIVLRLQNSRGFVMDYQTNVLISAFVHFFFFFFTFYCLPLTSIKTFYSSVGFNARVSLKNIYFYHFLRRHEFVKCSKNNKWNFQTYTSHLFRSPKQTAIV